MPVPSVFISSTCYDLKEQRTAIENALSDMQYNIVRSERSGVTFDQTLGVEASCYKEVLNCDIIVGVIGGRFGSKSSDNSDYSVTMQEIRTALENRKLVYAYVDAPVLSEYGTYKKNKENSSIVYAHADSPKVYEFIDELYNLNGRVPVVGFSSVNDIIFDLKRQLAGTVANYIADKARLSQDATASSITVAIEDLHNTISSMSALVDEFSTRNSSALVSLNAPISILKSVLGLTEYSVFFNSYNGMQCFLEDIGFIIVDENDETSYVFSKPDHFQQEERTILYVNRLLFDQEGKIKHLAYNKCKDLIRLEREPISYQYEDCPF